MSVEEVLVILARGASIEELLSRVPGLTRDDISACLEYAAETINRTRFVESIQRGLADTEAGRLVDDDDLWEEIERNS